MRDPVDNRTAELLDVEPKRRPGRPRKPGAMTNAERQAAYRARLKADGISTYARPGVPDLVHTKVQFADAELVAMHRANGEELQEAYAELDSTKAELAEAHETINELNDELIALRRWRQNAIDSGAVIASLRGELEAARSGLADKSVTGKKVTKNIPESEWPFPGERSAVEQQRASDIR
ncbi:hypothetical protein CF70_013060 [Cupriavidus sp. SK-3]|uniref:hypothetical protein n=1 Tax=Cupriavidus sp. SK-3 TaxID=1470558 RepID=UPI0004471E48|nr:hypothetical protein [Cupriavidus sp. SK-3]KDP85620.1 hypothetical protein CF70_013060 [Cupriavidus sp. SK-3]